MKNLYRYSVLLLVLPLLLPSGLKAQLTAPVDFALPANSLPSSVTKVQYYFDTDPGFGQGTDMPVTAGSDVNIAGASISVGTLAPGVHRLYFRSKNAKGIWGQTHAATFFVLAQALVLPPSISAADITAAECFFDTDPGFGKGSAINVATGSDVSVQNLAVEIDTLSTGVHRLYVRSKNSRGDWGMTSISTLYMIPAGSVIPAGKMGAAIDRAEYYIDSDPGWGLGTAVTLTPGGDVSISNYAVDISQLAAGVHRLCLRTRNTAGGWSMISIAAFYIVPVNFSIPPNAPKGSITALEYFFDKDPGFGNGMMLPVAATSDLSDFQITADITALKQDSTHTLYVRALDGWSQTTASRLIIGTVLPVNWLTFTGKMQPDGSVLLNWQTSAELNSAYYNIQRSSDGKNFEVIGRVGSAGNSVAGNTNRYSFTDPKAPLGSIIYRIQQVDLDGKSSYSAVLPISNSQSSKDGFYVLNNPAHSMLRVHIPTQAATIGDSRLQVFDLLGRQLSSTPTSNQTIQQIDVSALAPGAYIVRYLGANTVQSKKFLKK